MALELPLIPLRSVTEESVRAQSQNIDLHGQWNQLNNQIYDTFRECPSTTNTTSDRTFAPAREMPSSSPNITIPIEKFHVSMIHSFPFRRTTGFFRIYRVRARRNSGASTT
jgi:hypothetical protein